MKKIIYLAVSMSPVLAFAQNVGTTESSITSLLASVTRVLNALIPVFIGLAIIYFFWGLVQFVRAAGDEKARDAGKSHMIWGIVGIVVMISIFGLITWVQSATGINSSTTITLPRIPLTN